VVARPVGLADQLADSWPVDVSRATIMGPAEMWFATCEDQGFATDGTARRGFRSCGCCGRCMTYREVSGIDMKRSCGCGWLAARCVRWTSLAGMDRKTVPLVCAGHRAGPWGCCGPADQ
jgi:hypothetical protein